MAFVRGDRAGLIRLRNVLPNIFANFQGCDEHAVLLACGLYPYPGPKGVTTFYLNPEREGKNMINPGWHEISREGVSPTKGRLNARQLMDLYDGLSSSWSCSASNS